MNVSLYQAGRKGLLLTLVFFLSFSLISCGGNGEVLATYDGGEITRGDMRRLVEASGQPSDKITTAQQNEILKMIATYRLAANELEDDQEAQKWLERNGSLFERKALLRSFQGFLRSDDPFELISIQIAILRKDPQRDRKPEAEALAKKLNDMSSEEEIGKLVIEASESQETKMNAGKIVPHCISCQPDLLEFITTPLKKAEEGQFIVIDAENAFYVARRISTDELEADELSGFYQEYFNELAQRAKDAGLQKEISPAMIESQAQQYADRLVRSQSQKNDKLWSHIEELEKKHEFKLNREDLKPESFSEATGETWIIELDGKKRTVADFKKIVDTTDLNDSTMVQILQNIYIPTEILKLSPDYEEVMETELYDFLQSFYKNEALAGRYIQKSIEKMQVTDEQIQEYYDLRKHNQFNGKPLAAVKETIRQQLQQAQSQTAVQAIQDELFKKYNFKIEREKLKADEL
ncbi:MAG TPA: hypothetical protein DEA96_16130 [Leptospiraceae bacterium]|nr:hypothetical protein [Spirochaetaceae bacterium]HBS06498.1 hypothetical protein [Leptospiraceae bacterium]|tara:strand:+ start:47696 stop:49090 length:1395 start_codon:yes stop_codon:yes gene_type:complete